jgi:hypothetical protein
MAERIYVLNIYIDGVYQGTIKILASQLETGQFDADVEYALSRMGRRAKPTAVHLLKQLKRDNATRAFSLPAKDVPIGRPVEIRYHRTRKKAGEEVREPAPPALLPPDLITGPTLILVADSMRKELVYPKSGFTLDVGLSVIKSTGARKGYAVETRVFSGMTPETSIPDALATSRLYLREGPFSRVVILCHGRRMVTKGGKEKYPRYTVREKPTLVTWGQERDTDEVVVTAEQVLGWVHGYIVPTGGILYVAACAQFTVNWEYEIEEGGYDFDVAAVPGRGMGLYLVKDRVWWQSLAEEVFTPRPEAISLTAVVYE